MYETIDYQVEQGIGVVRINRPNKLNSINQQMVEDLRAVAAKVRDEGGLKALIFTGNGRAFCAGADISGIVEFSSHANTLNFLERIQNTFTDIEDLPVPTIAALNGLAYGGGCELAIACDLRVMARSASIGVPEILIGVLPGAGGTQRLTRMVPLAIAKQMLYFGDSLSSALALQHGLVNEVVPDGQELEAALKWARRLAELPPLALRCAKLLAHTAMNGDLKSGIESERQAVAFLFGTEDRREGMRAFLEKRKPSFSGR